MQRKGIFFQAPLKWQAWALFSADESFQNQTGSPQRGRWGGRWRSSITCANLEHELPLANSAAECLIAVADVLFGGLKKKTLFLSNNQDR